MAERTSGIPEPMFTHLRQLHRTLLILHKILLDQERLSYEQIFGPVTAPRLLQLVIADPHFAWLHAVSELIVAIDEVMEAQDPPSTTADGEALMVQTKALLTASENGTEFQKKYDAALQREPSVILAHKEVMQVVASASR
jgi:hypothetical protein